MDEKKLTREEWVKILMVERGWHYDWGPGVFSLRGVNLSHSEADEWLVTCGVLEEDDG